MINTLYNWARHQFLIGTLSWDGLSLRALLVSDAYVFDPDHLHVADLGGTVLSEQVGSLAGIASYPGVAGTTADPILFAPILLAGAPVVSAMVFASLVDNALLWYGPNGFGLPFAPDITPIYAASDRSTGGWFQV